MEHALMCPQCNAPLAPHRFARSIVCSYCGATVRIEGISIRAAVFHDAYRTWNSPGTYGFSSWVSLGNSHWALDQCIAHGEIADVFRGRRARWPTEFIVLKLLRDNKNIGRFNNEWESLKMLHRSEARGADTFTALLPQLVAHGELGDGQHAGRSASIFRWESGFRHTLVDVIQAHPQGIPPRASIWVWRRILETLSFIHASGMVHGAVLPPHLIIQDNEHGLRLVGYGCTGRMGQKLSTTSPDFEPFYPPKVRSNTKLTPELDLAMSARCIAAVLGGDPATASLPEFVPEPLAKLIKRIAQLEITKSGEDAWAIREELGTIAEKVFGPPKYIPILVPD